LVLQTETGATTAARFVATSANPFPGTEIQIERASGNWLRSLRLTGVSLSRVDSSATERVEMARIDTVSAQYRLFPLLQGRLHVTALSVEDPSFTARQAADSTWDWGRVWPASEEADTTEAFPLLVDRLNVSGGTFSASFFAQGRDSTARVKDFQLQAQSLQTLPAPTVQVDTLDLHAALPDRAPDVHLAARGRLEPTSVRLDTLRLRSPRSHVRGHGRLTLPGASGSAVDEVQFRLRGAPLALQDLTPFLPALDVDPTETVSLILSVEGTEQSLSTEAAAQFSGGGTVSLDGSITPFTEAPTGDSLRYQLEAEVNRLTTSLLGAADTPQNRVSGTATMNLRGPTLSSLNGTVQGRLFDTRWETFSVPRLRFRSAVEDGNAQFDLDGRLNDAFLSATGQARPLDEAPSVRLSAQAEDINVASFAPDAPVASSLSATAEMEAQALGTSEMAIDATVDVNPSRFAAQQLNGGSVTVSVHPDPTSDGTVRRGRVDGTIALPVGHIQAVGTARLNDEERFTIERLRLDSVDVASLVGDTTDSRITGKVQATGTGFDPATMRLDGTLDVAPSHYGHYRIASLTGTAGLSAGRFTADTEATLSGSEWSFSVRGRPFDETPTYEITDGRFKDVDVGALLPNTVHSSRLTGTFRAEAVGVSPSAMELNASLTLDSSRVNRQSIDEGSLTATLRNEQVRVNTQLSTPDGQVQLNGTARPFASVPTYELTNGTFSALDVGALAGQTNVRTSLAGQVSLQGRGMRASSLSADATLTLEGSSINDAAIPGGQFTFSVADGRTSTEGTLSIGEEGRIDLNGHVDSLASTPSYEVQVGARSIDVGAFLERDSVRARIDTLQWALEGRGTALDSLTARTTLTADRLQLRAFKIDALELQGALQADRLELDTLGVASNVLTADGSGVLGVTEPTSASPLTITADITDVQPLRELVGTETLRLREGTVRAEVRRSAKKPHLYATASLDGFAYEDFHLQAAEVNANGALTAERSFESVEASGSLTGLSFPTLTIEETLIEGGYDGQTVDLTTDIRLDQSHSATLQAAVTPGSEQTDVGLRQLDIRLGPDRWSLAEETILTVGAKYRAQNLHLRSDGQLLRVEGEIDPNGQQNLSAVAENVRLGGVSSLFGYPDLNGEVSGRMDLTGSASDPRLKGRLNTTLQTGDEAVGTAELDVQYEALAIALDATLTHADGSVLTASGTVPADLRLRRPENVDVERRPVQGELSAQQFPVAWIDPFLDPSTLREVTGILTADVTVGGTMDDPSLTGTASLRNAGAFLANLGTAYEGIQASLRFTEDQATLTDGLVRSSNGGRLQANGSITFSQLTVGSFDLAVEMSKFLAIDTRAYRRTILDGSMQLRGTTQNPILEGTAEVRSADIFYTKATTASQTSAAAATLTEEDRFVLRDRFGVRVSEEKSSTSDVYQALAMDLTVRIQRDTWLRSRSTPEMNVQFTGDLTLTKEHGEEENVFGTITVVEGRSTVRQFGQEFQITDGTLTFDGDPERPRLALTALFEKKARQSQEAEVQITLTLQGRPDNLSPTLSSDPPMDTSNMLSYLATGRPANELLSGNGGASGGGALGTQALLGQASSFVENIAASELGLDVVRLDIRPSGTSYLTMGRYFTPSLFLSIGQPVTTSGGDGQRSGAQVPNLTLEYQFTDTLFFRALNSQNALRLNFSFEYAY